MLNNHLLLQMKKQITVLSILLIPAIFSCGDAKTTENKHAKNTAAASKSTN